ncbi:Endonuclease/Exonuclease/phosphatase family protein [Rubripirellula obstinata]|uniref:Endonuclease/Exonuclease/phosphatase family protein n=1 Tax=Rubripirellula obstinata TaxID=406547 RepID=A0A5B1CLL7_9BACT|nr:endonuclease/exonuclease/phosphatase family protein [Rubripirellula obstinata]KAA1261978.1 Endonuclease/Exonuclease/phosphatase family protein [Rubripirellula obstinata]
MKLSIVIAAVLIVCATHCRAIATEPAKPMIRIATYNVSLFDKAEGIVRKRLASGTDKKAAKIAAVIQTVRPDILLLNEIDYDGEGETVKLFAEKFLAKSQRGLDPIDYPYLYAAPSNTGVASEMDLDGDGKTGGPADAWGFGVYPGQYSFAVLSRFPIDESEIRTFQNFRWRDFPDANKPTDPQTGQPYYPSDVWETLRLSSKNHVDVPIQVGDQIIHLLASHPTPPVFDGPEDRNGNRNHDEVQLWNHYISDPNAKWLTDDQGRSGGLIGDASDDPFFVIAGDLNTDPESGDSIQSAIIELTQHKRVQDPKPVRTGDSSSRATASFGPQREMRIDYVLPSSNFLVNDSAVFWPAKADPNYELITATDHRLVWVEVQLP